MDNGGSFDYNDLTMTALDTSRNEAELQRRVQRLARLVEVSVTLNSTLDLPRLLQFIIDTAAELLGSEAASILLVDENTNELKFWAAHGSDQAELARIPVPMDSSIAGTVFRENRSLIINEVERDPRHFREVSRKINFHTRSLVGVPMRIKDEVTGVLEALNKHAGDFNEEDAAILSIIASQAAVAINNARLLDALQKAYEELGKVDKIKSDFIAIASHELRTPLGVVLGYATFMKDEARGELSRLADAVLSAAMQMRSVVEDMTNMNLLHVGSTELLREQVPVGYLVKSARQQVAEMAAAKEQAITLNIPRRPLLVNVDPPKMMLAVTNLLNNAIKFTPARGRIVVQVQQRGSEVWIRVQDNGIGIPASEVETIFDEFYQVASHMTRRHGGLGMGLAIVRGLVTVHQGRVWAQSRGENQGATFTIALPLVD